MSGYAANGFENFANAKSAAGTEIVDKLIALAQRVEHQNMRASEITHMNEIADAGAVRGGIVRAENRDIFALSEGHLERQRNQVGLGHMVLAELAGGSRGIEITK